MKSKNTFKFLLLILFLITGLNNTIFSQSFTNAEYAEVLQKSMFFYEAQQSGTLPSFNRVTWRADSALTDGSEEGVDLTGGWYDAGDHVKFGFPMAYSASMLGWGALDFKDGYVNSGQYTVIQNNLRFVYDYFIKCHTSANELYGQVGGGTADHAYWGASEVMTMDRPAYKIDATAPGTDLAMETAAALAIGSMIFATDDPTYSATLLAHAKELYTFGETYQGEYTDAITDATNYYNSWSGYTDELVWGAIWLYRATNDETYLTAAKTAYESLSYEGQSGTYKSYKWTINWDDKTYGCYALMAKLTGEDQYYEDIERNLDYWTTGFDGSQITYTPGGLAWLSEWGSLRYASNASFLALYYANLPLADETKAATYKDFAYSQIDYALGVNPDSRSFVCGFGNDYPVNPHHRSTHGTWTNNLSGLPETSRHTLYGALVGGPDASDVYEDTRSNYVTNEVATDYNAGFSSALAAIMSESTTVITPDAIPEETVGEEYYTSIKSNSTGDYFFEPAVIIYNHTAWPSRKPTKLSFRYFIDISEAVSEGYSISDFSVALGGYAPDATLVDGFTLWSDNIYYVQIDYDDVDIAPISDYESKRECQFRIYGPTSVTWNNANDFSYTGVTSTDTQTLYVPVYENGVKVYGNEPDGGTSLSTEDFEAVSSEITVYPNPANDVLNLTFPTKAGINQVTVNDMLGKVLLTKTVDSNVQEYSLDISSIPTGLYLVCFKSSDDIWVKKVLKK
jgi:hypothetical protein